MKLINRSLYSQARDAILNMIYDSPEFMSKLPSEQELAETLGVSRNTVREALKSLENEGFVASRHGVGTFIIRDLKGIKTNIAVLDSTTKIITSHGYIPGTKSMYCDRRKIPNAIAAKLCVAKNSDVLYIQRVRTASDSPVVYVEDYIPYIDGMYESYNENKGVPLFDFLQSFDCKVSFSSCNIYAVLSDSKLQEALCLNSPDALLYLQQTHYSVKGTPILYSDSYFLSEKFEFNLIRKCAD